MKKRRHLINSDVLLIKGFTVFKWNTCVISCDPPFVEWHMSDVPWKPSFLHRLWSKKCASHLCRETINKYVQFSKWETWIFIFHSYIYSTTKHDIWQISNHNLLYSLDPPNQGWLFWVVGPKLFNDTEYNWLHISSYVFG